VGIARAQGDGGEDGVTNLAFARLRGHALGMSFDITRPSSERNRARPVTAAEAFVQSEAKSRIMLSRRARRIGFTVAAAGLISVVYAHGMFDLPFMHVTFPGGRQALLTFGQTVSVFMIPIGLLIGTAGFFLHRRFRREALADPLTAGIFDPSVEWPSDG
jgi:hypothetical protein